MSSIIPFQFEEKECPVILDDKGNPWWIAKNVCNILALENITWAMDRLDDDEKLKRVLYVPGSDLTLETLKSGQNRPTWTVNEPGLWKLIFRSSKPEAKRLQKWVTSEVLPQIRKTGAYGVKSNFNLFNEIFSPEEKLDLKETVKVLAELKTCLGPRAAIARFDHLIGYKRPRRKS